MNAPFLETNNPLHPLQTYPLVYLATAYSRYDLGIEAAFQDASRLAARLLRAGVKVYSPIAHTHPLAKYGNIDPLDHNIWIPFDESMMEKADALCVAQMSTWTQSKGIAHEIKFFRERTKPILYLDPVEMCVSARPIMVPLEARVA